tara:strand:- start:303 stop:404 length:102 start_codon:yes stop_codon:yes gene_type:complete
MYEAAFKSIDDRLWKDAGCSSELEIYFFLDVMI